MKVNESAVQSVLMSWCLSDMGHQLVLPNSRSMFMWEADLLSVTGSDMVHEFEVKLSLTDFKRDFKKKKHARFKKGNHLYGRKKTVATPNYFWFVTYGFEFDRKLIPDYAGWISVIDSGRGLTLRNMKSAPRMHTMKLSEKNRRKWGRLLSFRLMNKYQ